MAEVVASLLASPLVSIVKHKLGSAITEQASLLSNFRKDLEDMTDDFEFISAVLKDAENQSVKEERVRVCLKRLKDVALDISDMLEDYQDTSDQANAKMPGFLCCLPMAYKKIGMANTMKSLREKLSKIKKEIDSFKLRKGSSTTHEQHYDQRETISSFHEELMIGRDLEKQEIINMLSANARNDEIVIVPIYGLGGMGKTTLAQLVYNDAQSKKYDYRIWVYVSQDFNLNKIGSSIISQLPTQQGQQNMGTQQVMKQHLDKLLDGKTVLVVLDDLWEENMIELDKLRTMLHVKGSKVDVIVTTRKKEIAMKVSTSTYELQPLEDYKCWKIIKRSSKFELKSNKEKRKKIGLDIAKKCGGVALAAQAVGFLLRSIDDLSGWIEINSSDIWNGSFEDNYVLPSLKLSYERMPPLLRICFSYCAIFPKGHNIAEDDLVQQWIALDFTNQSEGKEYIQQLLGMSFLHVSRLPSMDYRNSWMYGTERWKPDFHDKVDKFLEAAKKHARSTQKNKILCPCIDCKNDCAWEDVTIIRSHLIMQGFVKDYTVWIHHGEKTFEKHVRYTMHDLVHDLARSTMVHELIVPSVQERNARGQKYCRYSLLKNYDQTMKLASILPLKIRALHFSDSGKLDIQSGAFSFANCLRTLDFSGCSGIFFPASIGQLKQLRCLIAPRMQNESLPECITELGKLQYLNINGSSQISALPESIGKLGCLKYLCLSGCSRISKLPESFGDLKCMVHLDMSGCSGIRELEDSLGKLRNLQHLDLSGCSSVKAIPEPLCGLTQLQYLDLSSCECLDRLPEAIGSLMDLQYLDMSSCDQIRALPESMKKLQNLLHLDLSCCTSMRYLGVVRGLTTLQHLNMSRVWVFDIGLQDLSYVLANLTNLKYLSLRNSIIHGLGSYDFPYGISGLTNLEHLDLSYNYNIASLPESFGNLERLHTLDLTECSGLKSLPKSIGTPGLKTLLLDGCSDEMMDQATEEVAAACGATEEEQASLSDAVASPSLAE